MRHNELRNSFVDLVTDLCDDDKMKLHLQPLQDETFAPKSKTIDDTRLDIRACELRVSRFSWAFFDVKVLNQKL